MKRYCILLALAISLLLVQAAAADLVVNGGFETGDFSGWTQSGNTGYTAVDNTIPHSGIYGVFFGPIGSLGYISQALGTVAGQSYKLAFWLESDGGFPNQAVAIWDGTTILTLVDIPSQGYKKYSFTVTASTNSTPLDLGFRNDPGGLYLDDVSVNPVPIPGAVWLLGSGLVGLAGLRGKFKS